MARTFGGRWLMVVGVASLALVLCGASLASAGAAMSIRGYTGDGAVSSGRTVRSSSAGQAPAPVIGEPVSETPDPNYPEDVNRPAPVIGEPVMETPDPNYPEDVNTTTGRSIRR